MKTTAYELAKAGQATAWNSWRQEQDLFGDRRQSRINLAEAYLSGVDLRGYSLVNVSFYRANASEALFRGVDCHSSDFHECTLNDADFTEANLNGCRLSRAYLRNAVLDRTDLRHADLRRASLTSASMVGTDVRGVDLSTTRGLDQEQIERAHGDQYTKLPPHLTAPSSWKKYSSPDDAFDDERSPPAIIPATVEIVVNSGIVSLCDKPGDAAFSPTIDVVNIRDDILDGLDHIRQRVDNHPLLRRSVDRYLSELRRDDFDIIMVGIRGIAIEQQVKALSDGGPGPDAPSLEGDLKAAISAVLIQHMLFIGQSHKWRAFLAEASQASIVASDRDAAREAGYAIAEVLEENSESVNARVVKALRAVTEELDISDDGMRLAVFNALSSVGNILKGVVTWSFREAKKFGNDAWAHFRDDLPRIVGKGAAKLLVGIFSCAAAIHLASQFPAQFGWTNHVRDLLGKTIDAKGQYDKSLGIEREAPKPSDKLTSSPDKVAKPTNE